MKGLKKCFGVLLLLFIIFGLSLNVCSDTNALKHEYLGIPFLTPYLPYNFVLNSDNNLYEIDWTNSGSGYSDFYSFSGYSSFELWVDADAYYSDLSNIGWSNNMSYMVMNFNQSTEKCETSSFSSLANFYNSHDSDYNSFRVSFNSSFLDPRVKLNFPVSPSSDSHQCQFHESFSDSSSVQFNEYALNNGLLSRPSVGFETGMINTTSSALDAYLNHFKPNWYTYDGFYVRDSKVDSDSGIHYNHSFSFEDMFTKNLKQFSKLSIPLWSYDDYWTDPSNFYFQRELKWTGVFDFDKPVTINPDMSSNSYFHILAYAYTQEQQPAEVTIPCSFNYVSLPDVDFYQLEYTCSGILPDDYIFFLPYLVMYNPDDYIFTTDGDWRWASIYLTTDNDDSPGQSFGGLISGLGQANSNSDSNVDWFSSLVNLFNFGLLNPFAPLFELFSDQSVCASIPTLSSMLHSEETQVCPFFSASTRAIVTPVLGISSMMLIFGFAVRWLGSSSGNFIEDSSGESLVPPNNSGTWGRRKTK